MEKAECPQIGNNEVLANESLPLDFAQRSHMQSSIPKFLVIRV